MARNILDALKQKLESAYKVRQEMLSGGNASDYAHYMRVVGQCEAFSEIVVMIDEFNEALEHE